MLTKFAQRELRILRYVDVCTLAFFCVHITNTTRLDKPLDPSVGAPYGHKVYELA
jgi:hypothetical protein